jgi:hypothetical protein
LRRLPAFGIDEPAGIGQHRREKPQRRGKRSNQQRMSNYRVVLHLDGIAGRS